MSFKAIELKDFSVDFLVYRLSSIFPRKGKGKPLTKAGGTKGKPGPLSLLVMASYGRGN